LTSNFGVDNISVANTITATTGIFAGDILGNSLQVAEYRVGYGTVGDTPINPIGFTTMFMFYRTDLNQLEFIFDPGVSGIVSTTLALS
jgi:hypothetical protein